MWFFGYTNNLSSLCIAAFSEFYLQGEVFFFYSFRLQACLCLDCKEVKKICIREQGSFVLITWIYEVHSALKPPKCRHAYFIMSFLLLSTWPNFCIFFSIFFINKWLFLAKVRYVCHLHAQSSLLFRKCIFRGRKKPCTESLRMCEMYSSDTEASFPVLVVVHDLFQKRSLTKKTLLIVQNRQKIPC